MKFLGKLFVVLLLICSGIVFEKVGLVDQLINYLKSLMNL